MSAWFVIVPFALVVIALVARARWRPALPVAAIIAAGLAGYAVSGSPALPDRPASPLRADPLARPAIEAARGRLLQNYGDVSAWLLLANVYARQGLTAQSVEAMENGVRANPDSPDMWVGLGNALVLHSDGQVSPAARLAFARANVVDPSHPAPRYFLGLALLQAGRPQQARVVWEGLRQSSPPGAPWLDDLDRKIAATRTMEALGVGEAG